MREKRVGYLYDATPFLYLQFVTEDINTTYFLISTLRRFKMKIAFASEEDKGLESRIAYHFGRCPYYVFVEVENGQIKSVETKQNPYFGSHAPGVVPEFIASQGAKVIIAGGMGPRAIDWFNRLGVQPITGVSGVIRNVLNDYLAGKLADAKPCDTYREGGRRGGYYGPY